MKLFFCGDIMPGGVLPYQLDYITPELKGFLDGFDFRIGTLEAAIGTGLQYDPIKMAGRQNIVYARNEDFFRVKEMGFDVVSLANNHIWDLGEDGLRNTIKMLQDNDIKYCGAGMDIAEASRPAVIEKDGIRVAILSYCMYGNPWLGYVELAGEKKAGVNPLDIDKAVTDIKEAKKEYDKVIVMPHWGREYLFEPLPECMIMAKQMIEAGADAVLGSHPHQVQPFVKYKGKTICFSMGNFLFPDFYMYPPRPIWYPDSIDEIKGIKDVVGYPFPIDEPIRQVWNPTSRYGCAVCLSFSKSEAKSQVQYIHSSNDNVISMSQLPRKMRYHLKIYGLMFSDAIFRFLIVTKRNTNIFLSKVLGLLTRK